MTDTYTTEKDIAAPATVAELIELLKQFPPDYTLDLYKEETDHFGYTSAASSYRIKVQALIYSRALELTVV